MARILIVDGNPDSQRAIGGLLKYRTRHTFAVADSREAGIRQALAMSPDIILINALLFMGNNYAFPRVMQHSPKTSHISFLVHATGALGTVARRQIEASGVAGVFELPISAEELHAEIEAALRLRKPKIGVQAVQWQRLNGAKTSDATRSDTNKQSAPKGVQKAVKAVQWPTASKAEVARHRGAGEIKPEETRFRAAVFPAINEQEKDRVKGHAPGDFSEQSWEKVDPKQVKRRSPKRGSQGEVT